MRPTPLSGAVALSVALALCRAAAPCGVALKAKPEAHSLDPVQETTWVVIGHRKGIQRMLLCLEARFEDDEHGLWLIPVPAPASEVAATVMESFPFITGRDPRWRAGSEIDLFAATIRATQIWPIVFDIFVVPMTLAGHLPRVHWPYSHASAVGSRASVLDPCSSPSLGACLRAEGLTVSDASLAALAPYWSAGSCVVAVRLDSVQEIEKTLPGYRKERLKKTGGYLGARGWPCVLLTFPSVHPICALLAPAQQVADPWRLELFVLGHVVPEAPSGWLPGPPGSSGPGADIGGLRAGHGERRRRWQEEVHALYRVAPEVPGGMPAAMAAMVPSEDVRFTRVYLSPHRAEFPPPLLFRPVEPHGMATAVAVRAFMRSWWAVAVAVVAVAVLSYVAAGLSGVTLHGRWRGLARFGLWNLGTFLTVIAVAHGSRGERRRLLVKPVDSAIFPWGPRFYSRLSVIFVILTVVAQLLVHVLLGV